MNYKKKKEYLEKISFLDLDFEQLPKLFGQYLEKLHRQKKWKQTQVATLMGKERSHINKAEHNTSDMCFTQVFMYYVVDDINMNKMMKGFFDYLLTQPRVLKRKK